MAGFEEYESYDAIGLAALARRGDVTPKELLEAAITRVEARNPTLNAMVMPMYEEARARIDEGLPEGPLTGVPFFLKDHGLLYKGFPTTFGSRILRNFVPDHDSTLMTRYRRAGLVAFGKTNTPEMAITVTTEPRFYGPCRNPWDTRRTCGGSSGGAAVAVAAGMVPTAHGSDGGGSIRIPASCCGLFGLKPTRGRIPAGPDVGEEWNGLSTNHVITRSVRDSALLLDIAAGPAPGDPYWAPPAPGSFLDETEKPPGTLRIAFTTDSFSGVPVDPECVAAVEDAARLCGALGHAVEEARLPFDFERYQAATAKVIDANTAALLDLGASVLGREVVPEEVEHITWRSAQSGRKITAPEFVEALTTLHQTSRKIAPFFETYDIFLCPVLLRPPVPLGFLDTQSEDVKGYATNLFTFFGFTGLFNATGQPSMSVPLYWGRDNLPIGLLFSARFGDDALLFRLAAQLEQARPWKDRRPPSIG
jgi:amidase